MRGFDCPREVEGDALVQWIARLSGSCVYGQWSALSWVLGYLSIACWLCAQMPQVVMNARRGSAHSLSSSFLLNWFLGDVTNLIGSIMTHQLPFQVLLAVYFCCIDAVLLWQMVYYSKQDDVAVIEGQAVLTPAIRSSKPLAGKGLVSVLALSNVVQAAPLGQQHSLYTEEIGTVVSYICTAFYISSRLPQIIKNHTQSDMHGIHMACLSQPSWGTSSTVRASCPATKTCT